MRARAQTLYDVLGVGSTASAAEIRAAYHDLAARYHPDRHDGNELADLATEKLKSINAAYEVLSDPARRAAYDSEITRESQTSRPQGSAARQVQIKLPRALLLIIGLALLLRFGPLLVRALLNLVRLLWEAALLLRGTPLFAGLFLLVVAISVRVILRRGRARRQK